MSLIHGITQREEKSGLFAPMIEVATLITGANQCKICVQVYKPFVIIC